MRKFLSAIWRGDADEFSDREMWLLLVITVLGAAIVLRALD